jgi:hypothetical protein
MRKNFFTAFDSHNHGYSHMESSRGNCIQRTEYTVRGTNIADLWQYTVLPYNTEFQDRLDCLYLLKVLQNWNMFNKSTFDESVL